MFRVMGKQSFTAAKAGGVCKYSAEYKMPTNAEWVSGHQPASHEDGSWIKQQWVISSDDSGVQEAEGSGITPN